MKTQLASASHHRPHHLHWIYKIYLITEKRTPKHLRSNHYHLMVVSSFTALNKIEVNGMMELNKYISYRMNTVVVDANQKPRGLHFLVDEKIFKGTNQPFISCPIQFRLRGQKPQTLLCQPVWTKPSLRCKVNRQAKIGVMKHSVIRLGDYSIVLHSKAPLGYFFFLRQYQVIKKDVDKDAYDRWLVK